MATFHCGERMELRDLVCDPNAQPADLEEALLPIENRLRSNLLVGQSESLHRARDVLMASARLRLSATTLLNNNQRVLTAIEGVLNTMGRMETRMGNIETAIQKMATQSKDGTKAGAETSESTTFPKEETLPTASSGEAEGGVKDEAGRWDGTVDEDAYFDDDPDEDLGDWRDVKRLEKLL